jgi:hypothetical protein
MKAHKYPVRAAKPFRGSLLDTGGGRASMPLYIGGELVGIA